MLISIELAGLLGLDVELAHADGDPVVGLALDFFTCYGSIPLALLRAIRGAIMPNSSLHCHGDGRLRALDLSPAMCVRLGPRTRSGLLFRRCAGPLVATLVSTSKWVSGAKCRRQPRESQGLPNACCVAAISRRGLGSACASSRQPCCRLPS